MWSFLVEDEKQLANLLQRGLEEEGHAVDVMHNGAKAELQGIVNDYDMVVLDWRLPGRDGKQILQRWREEGCDFPVLMLTALSDLDHKVDGLDAGADDYMAKPFSFEELLARIRALGRRSAEITTYEKIKAGPIELDSRRRRLKVCEIERSLRPKEFMLLKLLLTHPERVYSKRQIAERVWGSGEYVSDNTIEATVSTLRQKLAESFDECGETYLDDHSKVVETIRGA